MNENHNRIFHFVLTYIEKEDGYVYVGSVCVLGFRAGEKESMRPVIFARTQSLSLYQYGWYLNIPMLIHKSKKTGIRSYSIDGTHGKGPVGDEGGQERRRKKKRIAATIDTVDPEALGRLCGIP